MKSLGDCLEEATAEAAAGRTAAAIATCREAIARAPDPVEALGNLALTHAAQFQLESPLSLATCVLPVRRVVSDGAPLARAAVGVAADAIVFGEFVGPVKLSPRCLEDALRRAVALKAGGSA